MAVGEQGLSGAALKKAQAYNRSMEKAAKSLKLQQKLIGGISSSLAGIDGGAFFRSLTSGEVEQKTAQWRESLDKLQTDAKAKGDDLNKTFNEMAESMGLSGLNTKELSDKLGISLENASSLRDSFEEQGPFIGDVATHIKDMGPDADKFLEAITESNEVGGDLSKSFKKGVDEMQGMNEEADILKDQIANAQEKVLDLAEGFAKAGANLTKNVLGKLKEFDEKIKASQIETGINFTQNTTQMAMLTSESAKFGMSIEGTAKMMGDLGKELRTANFDVLSEAAGDLIAMQKATGLASSDTAKIAKEFIKFGRTAKDVKEFSEETMQMSVAYGLSGKAVMEEMANSLKKMRTMGFIGGEQSLRRMVLESKRLGMNVDEIFETGKRARTIEGAMEMAADLQLAGGSFAAINPMDLLAAARKGPEELQKILGGMGKDIGAWVKDKEGKDIYQFDPVDTDRLQIVADATGQSMDSLTNMIAQNAEDIRKADLLGGLGGSIDGLDDEEKAFLMQMTSIGKDGQMEISGKMEGISDLSQVNKDTIAAALKVEKEKNESLEEQASQNMAFTESLTALKASFLNVFSVFQPVLQYFADTLNAINQFLPGWAKGIMAGIIGGGVILFSAAFSAAKWILQGMNLAKGFQMGTMKGGLFKRMGAAVKGIFSKGGGDAIKVPTDQGNQAGAAASGSAGGLKGLAQGLKSMGHTNVFKGILAMALLGPAMIVFLPAIPGLLLLGVVGMMAGLLIAAFNALSTGLGIIGNNLVNVAKGALGMAIIGIAFIPFAYAMMMMGEVNWLNVLAGVGIAMLVVVLLTALGFGLMFAMPWLLMGAAGLMIAGIALLVAAVTMGTAGEYLAMAVGPLEAIAGADWTALLPFAAVISEFGFGMIWGALGLLAGAVALYLAAPLLAASVEPLKEIAGTDWESLKSFADALGYVGPAMLGFALAGLVLLNPLMLFGMFIMLTSLATLSLLMNSLAPNLSEGASGIERMAEGVISLDDAVRSLDLDKLTKLRNVALSIGFSGRAMENMVKALGKIQGGAGGGGGKTVHVIQLELDGKKIKEIIINDTKHMS